MEEQKQCNFIALKEMILDEQRLVTYISLSRELCLHVNESKYLLEQAVVDIRSKNSMLELNVNYIISGLTGDSKALTTVCNEQDLKDLNDKFKVVFFHHIYSVSKGKPSVDSVSLMAVHKFDDFSLCMGSVKSRSCVKYMSDEISHFKSCCVDSVNKQESNNKTEKKIEPSNTNGVEKSESVTKVHETKSEPNINPEVASTIANLGTNTKLKVDKKNSIKSQKGITGFFSKSNSVPSIKPAKLSNVKDVMQIKQVDVEKSNNITSEIVVENNKIKVEDLKEVKSTENMNIDETSEEIELIENVDKKDKTHKIKNAKTGPINKMKKKAKVDLKRKRVLLMSDSENEEDDLFQSEAPADHESEDEIPATPTMNTIQIKSNFVNPKKRRRIVDKTYTDEDGYILTKKEEVYESCSENENDTADIGSKENIKQNVQVKTEVSPPIQETKKDVPRKSKKNTSQPQKGKQATLMNFFKKI